MKHTTHSQETPLAIITGIMPDTGRPWRSISLQVLSDLRWILYGTIGELGFESCRAHRTPYVTRGFFC